MKALNLTILLAVLLPAMAVAQQIRTNTATRIQFETIEFDFGYIPQNTPVTTVFVYRATGAEPVVMHYVKPSCGCTMPEYSKEPLLPGQNGEMKVTFDAKEVGVFTKEVIVQSNAYNNPRQILKIRGEVYAVKTPDK